MLRLFRHDYSIRNIFFVLGEGLFNQKNMSVFFDLMIVFKTVKTVIFGEGAAERPAFNLDPVSYTHLTLPTN